MTLIKALKFLITTLMDFAGQILTGIGLMLVLGAIAAQLWIMLPIGIILAGIGFFLLRG